MHESNLTFFQPKPGSGFVLNVDAIKLKVKLTIFLGPEIILNTYKHSQYIYELTFVVLVISKLK